MVPECASAWRCPRSRKTKTTKTVLPVFPNANPVAIVEVAVKCSVPRKAISGAHLIHRGSRLVPPEARTRPRVGARGDGAEGCVCHGRSLVYGMCQPGILGRDL